jgi:hypothetical protein
MRAGTAKFDRYNGVAESHHDPLQDHFSLDHVASLARLTTGVIKSGTWSRLACGNFSATSDIWHPYLSQYCINAAAAIVIAIAR